MKKLSNYFEEYIKEAYRLETLPVYKVDGEWEKFQAYERSGKISKDKELLFFAEKANKKILSGARHIRIRVLPKPLTKYFLFETLIGYIPQQRLGVEFSFIRQSDFDKLKKTSSNQELFSDYWIFDSEIIAFLKYDNEGKFIEYEIKEDLTLVNKALQLRYELLKKSLSFTFLLDFLRSKGLI